MHVGFLLCALPCCSRRKFIKSTILDSCVFRAKEVEGYLRAVIPALFWVIMQRVAIISYRRFGTTHWFHTQGRRIQKRKIHKGFLTLEDGTDSCPETSVINYNYSLRNNPEELSSNLLRGGSLIAHFGNATSTQVFLGFPVSISKY